MTHEFCSDGCFDPIRRGRCCDLIGRGSKRRVSMRFMKSPFSKIPGVINYPHGLPVGTRIFGGGRKFQKVENIIQKKMRL